MAKKKKIEPEKIETPQDISTEGLETISIKELENLDIFTEESAFLNDHVKSEFEALFEPKTGDGGESSESLDAFEVIEGMDDVEILEEDMSLGSISSSAAVDLSSSSEEDKEALQRAKQMSFQSEDENKAASLEGTELDEYESVNIEDLEFVDDLRAESIIESILFATDKPVSVNSIKLVFKGTNIKGDKIRKIINKLAVDYSSGQRGIYIEEVTGGYQLRTKLENMNFLKRTLKARPFKLSGPALEVLAIVAYKQPVVKHELDEIRGVESGHLLRALMEKGIVTFAGKSDLPGKPMQYITTKKFLEIFGLRNLKELPTLSQIDELLPEGINEDDEIKNSKLSSITDSMSQNVGDGSYSQGEDELIKISEQLDDISTSSEFFEQEKQRQKEKKEFEKAQNIREALELAEAVPTRDKNWLIKYDEALAAGYKTIEAYENFKLEQKQQQEKQSQEATVSVDSEEVTHEQSRESAYQLDEDYPSDIDSVDFEEKEEELPCVATDEELEGL